MVSIIAAFQFLTIFPALIKRAFTANEMGRSVGWFPLVGLVLGLLLYAVNHVAREIFPGTVPSALTLLAWVAFTRAFHLDGFMDACDGLFGGFTPERRLEIMKDSRVGAFGAAGGALILLTQFAALASSLNPWPAIVLAAVMGRWASPLVIYSFPYAREDGLGIDMKRNVGRWEILIATGIAGLTSWIIGGWLGLAQMLGAGLVGFAVALYAMRLLRGLTGDIYGAVTTLVETAVLLFFTVSF